MCDCIHNWLAEEGIAKKLDAPIWMDKDGNEVDSEEKACGCKVECDPLFPESMCFLDETGCNTNQKKDGQHGGETHLGEAETSRASIPAASQHLHFTLLPVKRSVLV